MRYDAADVRVCEVCGGLIEILGSSGHRASVTVLRCRACGQTRTFAGVPTWISATQRYVLEHERRILEGSGPDDLICR